MTKVLFAIMLLLCPMVVIGQDADTIIVKKNPLGLVDAWDVDFYTVVYTPYVVDRNEPLVRCTPALDTLIGGYRVRTFVDNRPSLLRFVGGNPKQRRKLLMRCYKVDVLPIDTTDMEFWKVNSHMLFENLKAEMKWTERDFSGNKRTGHNELIHRVNSLLRIGREVNMNSRYQFTIGAKGRVRSYSLVLDSLTYHNIPPQNYVQLIDTLNAHTPFFDWREVYPADTIPAVYDIVFAPPVKMVNGNPVF